MHVLGTAGHVDHGKSALVRALTGTDPDRWIEEKLRGMTLDLGFAHLQLVDGLEAGIIDVPGHERFIHNMLAGAAGMELLLLVVAANEGARRQTFEQLAILGYLGVGRTIVVLSKADLVDAAELARVGGEVARALHGTIAAGAPTYAVSTVSGAGLDELRAGIAQALRELPVRDRDAPAYLPIDRVFALPGHGTIVTGTLMQGSIQVGDALHLTPLDRVVRVRNLHVFGRQHERVDAGSRVAINLPGVDRVEIGRGAVLAAPNLAPQAAFEVTFAPLAHALGVLRRRTPVRVHVGAAEILGTLVFAQVPETIAPVAARLTLRTPTVAPPGTKFVVRRPSPKDLLGGGAIARSGGAAVDGDEDEPASRALAALREAGVEGATAARVGAAANLGETLATQTLERLCDTGRAYRLAKPAAYAAADAVDALAGRICAAFEANETRAPWLMGSTSLGLARALDVAEALLVRVLALLVVDGRVAHRVGYYCSLTFSPRLLDEQQAFFERELAEDRTQPFVPVALAPLVARMRATRVAGISQAFDTLVASGAVVKVGDDVYRSGQISAARAALEGLFGRARPITPSALRDALGTSRKYVVPLLEWFDAAGVTVRSGDVRLLRARDAEGAPDAATQQRGHGQARADGTVGNE